VKRSEPIRHLAPSRLRYFIAEGRLIHVYLLGPLILGVWIPIAACRPSTAMFHDWSFLLLFLFVLVLAPVFLVFVALPYAWFVLWPLYFLASRWNGAPFHPGDRVRILSRPYRDHIVEVLEVINDRHKVRVLLDEKKGTKEIFSFTEVCRDCSS
jgi:hypothetical protein